MGSPSSAWRWYCATLITAPGMHTGWEAATAAASCGCGGSRYQRACTICFKHTERQSLGRRAPSAAHTPGQSQDPIIPGSLPECWGLDLCEIDHAHSQDICRPLPPDFGALMCGTGVCMHGGPEAQQGALLPERHCRGGFCPR